MVARHEEVRPLLRATTLKESGSTQAFMTSKSSISPLARSRTGNLGRLPGKAAVGRSRSTAEFPSLPSTPATTVPSSPALAASPSSPALAGTPSSVSSQSPNLRLSRTKTQPLPLLATNSTRMGGSKIAAAAGRSISMGGSKALRNTTNLELKRPPTPTGDLSGHAQLLPGLGSTLSGPSDRQLSHLEDAVGASRPSSAAGGGSRPASAAAARRPSSLGEALAKLSLASVGGQLPLVLQPKPELSAQPMFMRVRDHSAARVLRHLRIGDIGALDAVSPGLHEFCRSPASGLLLVPNLRFNRTHASRVDMPSVEDMVADEITLITTQENEGFASLLGTCGALQNLYCARNQHLIMPTFARGLVLLQQLLVLDLSSCEMAADDRFQFRKDQPLESFFAALPPLLQYLNLSHNLLRDRHAVQLVDALGTRCTGGGTGLDTLLVRSNHLGDESGAAFADLLRGPAGANLRVLDMRTNKMQVDGATAMLSALRVHPRLQEFRLGYNRKNQEHDEETTKLACALLHKALSDRSVCTLEALDLNNVRIGDDGAGQMSMALLHNSQLRRLYLAFNSIGPEGARYIAAMFQENRTLHLLDLRDNEIGDEGATYLANGLVGNYAMRRLLLARNDVGRLGAEALALPVRSSQRLFVEFGASGDDAQVLQSLVRRTPRAGNDRSDDNSSPTWQHRVRA